MLKEARGTKRVCPETGKRFYDLNRDPIVSPYTQIEYELSFFTGERSQNTMADKADQSALSNAASEELTDDVDALDSDDGATSIDEDIPDIDDDDDTVDLEEIADVAKPTEESS
ncbi:MAG: TIGR02300 family protein [Paracoccaceae bacterium]|nr:TIGR02300 family protein [Paracoccaceae bacterium]MDE2911864.1 TIGR02300 family protein [Paracoccaceae bacterium]